jgi:formylglycine-generating enzyme required for sulfatase activity
MKKYFLLLPFYLLVYGVWAQNPIRKGSDYAVFFYVTTFQNGWERLPETEGEVVAIAEELRNNYGFLTEVVANPTKRQIEDKLAEVNKRNYEPDDQLLYFFSMHGQFEEEDERGYLIPADGANPHSNPDAWKTWLSYDDLSTYFTRNKCRHVLVALDACYSGAFGDRWKGAPSITPWDTEMDCRQKIVNALAQPSRMYFTSGSSDQRTPAKSKFANRWLEALRKGKESGIVRTNDLRYFLSSIENPQPEGGSFSKKHEAGGDFVFVHEGACKLDKIDNENEKEFQKDTTSVREYFTKNPNMIFINGGSFFMGSDDGDADEKPIHEASVSDFYISKYEVTVEEFSKFIEETNYQTDAEKLGGSYLWVNSGWQLKNGINWRHDANAQIRKKEEYNHPVIHVSWNDAIEYCNWLSVKEKLLPVYMFIENNDEKKVYAPSLSFTNGYRLPTEAEWEFSASIRGSYVWSGTDKEENLSDYCNCFDFEDDYPTTAPVGSFRPNSLGLYDMSGNVWEWCWDSYTLNYAKSQSQNNSTDKVLRDGSWFCKNNQMRCANRNYGNPTIRNNGLGFRVAASYNSSIPKAIRSIKG